MNEMIPVKTVISSPLKHSLAKKLCSLGPKPILLLSGMFCVTVIVCVGLACFSDSELSLNANGFTITQPKTM